MDSQGAFRGGLRVFARIGVGCEISELRRAVSVISALMPDLEETQPRGEGNACPWGGELSLLRCTLFLKARLPF